MTDSSACSKSVAVWCSRGIEWCLWHGLYD